MLCLNAVPTLHTLPAAPLEPPAILVSTENSPQQGTLLLEQKPRGTKRVSHPIQLLQKRPRLRQNRMIRKSYPSETFLIKTPLIRIRNSWEFMETTCTKLREESKMTKFGRQDDRNWSHCQQSNMTNLEGTLVANLSRSWRMNLKEYIKGNGTAMELSCSRWSFSNGPKM
jgi:hypothetical protein